ncbi:MAG: response regulator transcription factor [Pseudomonadota bacterium]
MDNFFITRAGRLRERWREAFPDACVAETVAGSLDNKLVWLDASFLERQELDAMIERCTAAGANVVVLSPTPAEADAVRVMARGARGYAHVFTRADTLRQIPIVLERGGVWLEPGLMASLLRITERLHALSSGHSGDLSSLTEREKAVAQLVGGGASNREIAQDLDITERTVKAHLTAIFEKLEVRDRVQLAIRVRDCLN